MIASWLRERESEGYEIICLTYEYMHTSLLWLPHRQLVEQLDDIVDVVSSCEEKLSAVMFRIHFAIKKKKSILMSNQKICFP